MTSETMIKSAGTIEQKGVAQLLQIEEVRLNSSRRCGFSQSLLSCCKKLLSLDKSLRSSSRKQQKLVVCRKVLFKC